MGTEDLRNNVLFLFSSNIRPLYEQDILDVLAAPSGLRYRFRYESDYVADDAKRRWAHLGGTAVLVHFSLQQEAKYQEPAFFPIRSGVVTSTATEANLFFVEFSLGSYVALLPPAASGTDALAQRVQQYAAYLREKGVDRPYGPSASLGLNVLDDSGAPIDCKSDETTLFRRIGTYLSRTNSFKRARFIRFVRLSEQGVRANPIPVNAESNAFELKGGVTYRLAVLQAQPVEVTEREPFLVKADGQTIKVVGREGFDLASRYDLVEVSLHAFHPGVQEIRETVVVIEPGDGRAGRVQGSTIRLPMRVHPPKQMLAVAAGSSLLLILLALPALMPASTVSWAEWWGVSWWKLLLVAIGAFGANYLWLYAPSGRTPLTPRV